MHHVLKLGRPYGNQVMHLPLREMRQSRTVSQQLLICMTSSNTNRRITSAKICVPCFCRDASLCVQVGVFYLCHSGEGRFLVSPRQPEDQSSMSRHELFIVVGVSWQKHVLFFFSLIYSGTPVVLWMTFSLWFFYDLQEIGRWVSQYSLLIKISRLLWCRN